VLIAISTPLLGKNPAKALTTPGAAFVFSMSRLTPTVSMVARK
jgi:hypothetical protein